MSNDNRKRQANNRRRTQAHAWSGPERLRLLVSASELAWLTQAQLCDRLLHFAHQQAITGPLSTKGLITDSDSIEPRSFVGNPLDADCWARAYDQPLPRPQGKLSEGTFRFLSQRAVTHRIIADTINALAGREKLLIPKPHGDGDDGHTYPGNSFYANNLRAMRSRWESGVAAPEWDVVFSIYFLCLRIAREVRNTKSEPRHLPAARVQPQKEGRALRALLRLFASELETNDEEDSSGSLVDRVLSEMAETNVVEWRGTRPPTRLDPCLRAPEGARVTITPEQQAHTNQSRTSS